MVTRIASIFGQVDFSPLIINSDNSSKVKADNTFRELNTPISIEGEPFTLSIKVNLLESEDLILSIALLFMTILILLLFGLFFINKKLSLKLWKPFYDTLQQIENFDVDKHIQLQFPSSDIQEFNRLNSSIDTLIKRNIKIYENQREFVENAAHELQTPIAIFKAKIDTLIQRSDITEGQSEILTSLNHIISRLNRLNKNLLLLSKIEKQQFKETENFSIQALIENQFDFFIEQAEQKNIKISTSFQHDFNLNANKGLTEILID